jgi:lactate racemase
VAADPAGALGDWHFGGRLAIAVPDGTRQLDLPLALEALLPRVPPSPIVIGLGLHRRMEPAELAHLARWKVLQHDPDDCVPTADVDGIPGAVGRPVADAGASFSIGVAELHQYAGLSGGHKGVAVGCGGRQTISALHHRARVLSDGVRLGRLEGNPFREAVDRLGEAAGCRWALVFAPSAGRWLFGPPGAVLRHALGLLDPWEWVDRPAEGALLRLPPAKGTSLYQASRAATYLALSPSPPLLPGSTLVIHAPMQEGLGAEDGFVRAMGAFPPPWTGLLEGPPPTGPGAQRAVMIARMAQSYRLLLRGCSDPGPFLEVGLDASSEDFPCPPGWLEVPKPFWRLPQWRKP